MKRLGIDARLISQTGVGVYTQNLLYFLEKNSSSSIEIYVYLRKEDLNSVDFKRGNFVKREANYRWHSIGEQVGFLKLLNGDNLDLMHFTYFSYPIFYSRKFVSTIHDLTPLLFKTGKASTKNIFIYNFKYFMLSLMLKHQLKKSVAVITPTEAVKNQIISNYSKQYFHKVIPIQEGVNEQIKKTRENKLLKKKFNYDFVLCVNNFYPHKNTLRLIEAFLKVKSRTRLVLVGPMDYFSKQVLRSIIVLKQNDRIIMFNNPKPEDLVFFYKAARAIINPSLSEGFGLSLLEAAYFNCPIIASNIPVFNEVLGDSYLKFNPYDSNDIAKKINYFIAKKPKFDYKKIIAKYSFEKMTLETIKIYNKYL